MIGLWFSLGHSTIVIVVNIAIAISVQIYDKLDGMTLQFTMEEYANEQRWVKLGVRSEQPYQPFSYSSSPSSTSSSSAPLSKPRDRSKVERLQHLDMGRCKEAVS